MSQEMEMIPEVVKPSVPWTFLDVVLFFGLWFVAQIFIGIVLVIAMVATGSSVRQQVQTVSDEYQHPIAQMIQDGESAPVILLVAFLSIVVVAPLIEEFLFRLIFQNWLEAKFLQFRVPCAGGVAITIASFFFAMIHLGGGGHHIGAWPLFCMFVAFIIVNLLLFVFGIVYLVVVRNVKILDYLMGTERFFRPGFFKTTMYCLLVVLFCQGLGTVLGYMNTGINVTPIPIFFFSLALGALYGQTKNLLYCILLHACLNAVALVLILLSV